MSCVLKNGIVVDPFNHIHGKYDVKFDDGKIIEIGHNLSGDEEKDVSDKWIIPGVIDSHVHLIKDGASARCTYKKVVETGVTTAIDFAGPAKGIVQEINEYGYGLNVGCMETISRKDSRDNSYDVSDDDICRYFDRIMSEGALGSKLLCGHYPITPRAIKKTIEEANARKIMIAYHVGSTETRSDLEGMREAVRLCGNNHMILAHINAYCRGKIKNLYQELEEAFEMLRQHPNIISDCHLAVMNGCFAKCIDGVPEDNIVKNCLKMSNLPETQEGLREGIKKGIIKVIYYNDEDNGLLEGDEALKYFDEHDTNVTVSFRVNSPAAAAACMTERRTAGGDFLIKLTGTDGGYIPRNDLLNRALHYYGLGYLTLEEVVCKVSLNAAKAFGLKNKGHLSAGADADITIVNPKTLMADESYIGGQLAMSNRKAVKRPGKMLITSQGIDYVKSQNVAFDVIDSLSSELYMNN